MGLTVWSSARYVFPLPEGHRFPVAKYALLRAAVIAEGIVPAERVLDPPRADEEALALVHTREYLRRFREGALDPAELRLLGFPWSEALVERSYRAVGGTIAAARHALEAGVAMNLAGGTHHAFPDHGEGFCVFNDVAVAIRLLRREGRLRRAAVIDLDVHQGNGTHAIFAGDAEVVTFSMHGGRNRWRRSSMRSATRATATRRCSSSAMAGAPPRHPTSRRTSARAPRSDASGASACSR
jgi:acetoin utilization deacetylase AcuC-like enzyme